jgi:nucleotide sugar dehydrogenase
MKTIEDIRAIAVCGLGVVGTAVHDCLKKKIQRNQTGEKGIKGKISVLSYDKFKNGGIGNKEDMISTDLLFLCLPTPYSEEKKCFDKGAIEEICSFLSEKKYKGIVIVKSTVEPGTTSYLAEKYGLSMVHNPEFLTAKTAFEDFENQKHIVVGGENKKNVRLVCEFYEKFWPISKISVSSSCESEIMKLSVNSFYATKIQFFNEIYFLCNKMGSRYERIKNMILENGWVSNHHVEVPGTDGEISYGGMCFPKDTNALNQFLSKNNLPNKVLQATIEERNIFRGKSE